ncbi:MAG: 30S ribosomal protein S1 [Firmicutes bacterium]|nr:30S ribosomal protein S1 [Bacillota bacterium]
MKLLARVAAELAISLGQVESVEKLLLEGNTIPFIARYRKEVTGELDEVKLRALEERLTYLKQLEERKGEVQRLIGELGKMTPEIAGLVEKADTLQQVEDLYLPFRPKRRTRATIAKEKGLAPLAELILADPLLEEAAAMVLAVPFCDVENGLTEETAALSMAKDILAEQLSENFKVREAVRYMLRHEGRLQTEVKNEENITYQMYFSYEEPLRRLPPHRLLAINRGEKEEALTVKVIYDEDRVYTIATHKFLGGQAKANYLVKEAITDGCKRLLLPSLEREIRAGMTVVAEEQAILVFGQNIKQLLLQAPVKGKTILAIDPAYRTGCKLAVVNPTGKVLATAVSYFTPPQNDKSAAARLLLGLIREHVVSAIAIGNGTGSREAEEFVAELVKIDPKAIGVGQYQHDVNQKALAIKLEGVVEDCVNGVGVDLNTSSPALLRYVAGISPAVAKNIVAFRDEHGPYKSREELKKIPRLGPATFVQCAGFLRIPDAANLLDNTPVHPESYTLTHRFLGHLELSINELTQGGVNIDAAKLRQTAETLGAGLPTLRDIYLALQKPGRDPREDVEGPVFRSDVLRMEDLTEGMVLRGVVRNVVDFGAFVDIGVKQDGLVHISEISETFVKHPSHAVVVGEVIEVRVMGIDKKRQRISLSRKGLPIKG